MKLNSKYPLESQVDEKYENLVNRYRWFKTEKGYVRGRVNGRHQYLHKFLLETELGRPLSEGMTTDHINENKLDNRIENLQELSNRDNFRKSHVGKTYSRERVEKMIETKSWSIIHIDSGMVFDSAKKAGEYFGLQQKQIQKISSGLLNRKDFIYEKDYLKEVQSVKL